VDNDQDDQEIKYKVKQKQVIFRKSNEKRQDSQVIDGSQTPMRMPGSPCQACTSPIP
jgi:hypothetical protein